MNSRAGIVRLQAADDRVQAAGVIGGDRVILLFVVGCHPSAEKGTGTSRQCVFVEIKLFRFGASPLFDRLQFPRDSIHAYSTLSRAVLYKWAGFGEIGAIGGAGGGVKARGRKSESRRVEAGKENEGKEDGV